MDGYHHSQILLLVSLLFLSLLDALPARAQLKPGDTLGKEN